MGASSSSYHQPLGGKTTSTFRRAASLRFSKSKNHKTHSPKRLDTIRQSLRDSFRRKRKNDPSRSANSSDRGDVDLSKSVLWQMDEVAVRSGNCFFLVKYLGCVEVFESRGMETCEEAVRKLKNSMKKPIKAVLHISGDGIRVVENASQGLIVDQTIEKVSFCAPDRSNEKGFSYICRDGTTRRWICHGFFATEVNGERLSHAVGCAFAICLERKQKREKELVTMKYDTSTTAFTRLGSFRPLTLAEKGVALKCKASKEKCNSPIESPRLSTRNGVTTSSMRARPHASLVLLQRQGSFRGLSHLGGNQASPFKRQLSLRVNQMPSNFERNRRFKSFRENTSLSNLIASDTRQVTDEIVSLCKKLSEGFSLMKNDDDISITATGKDNTESEFQKTERKDICVENVEGIGSNNDLEVVQNSISVFPTLDSLTPPPSPSAQLSVSNLPAPEQWLGKVAELCNQQAVAVSLPKPNITNPFLDNS